MDYSREVNKRKRFERKLAAPKVINKVGVTAMRAAISAAIVGVTALIGIAVGAYLAIIENIPEASAAAFVPVSGAAGEKSASVIIDAHGHIIERLVGGVNREYASLDDIPLHVQHAFVAIEDERFLEHDGVDFRGTARAVYVSLTSSSTQGGSTITQQVIKNRLQIKRNNLITKVQEQHIAVDFEDSLVESFAASMQIPREEAKIHAKNYILEVYLNLVGMGHGQEGVQAAAKRYFDKDVGELTLAESAVIASITQNPTMRDPIRRPERNRQRAESVLKKMLELNFITQEEFDEAWEEDVYSKINAQQRKREETQSAYSYYTDRVIKDVKRGLTDKLGYTSWEADELIFNGGLTIHTPQDSRIQRIVDEAMLDESNFPEEYALEARFTLSLRNTTTGSVTHHREVTKMFRVGEGRGYDAQTRAEAEKKAEEWINEYKDRMMGADDVIHAEQIFLIPQPQIGMVIIDYYNGHVKAIAGGRGEKTANRAFSRATDARRQPGSVFKVLASYAPALEAGLITAATPIDDVPYEVAGYRPQNWYDNPRYRGLNTVRDGIILSMNVLAVKNMHNLGGENALAYLRDQFNFSSLVDDDRYLPTALGGVTYGVYQHELAAAYGAIANLGEYNEPIFYTRVLDRNGFVILENEHKPRRIMEQTTAFILTDMMKDVMSADAGGTGRQGRFKTINMPIAGKTGTTSEINDLVFSGYTPYYCASIWLGYDTRREMSQSSTQYHMWIWRDVMEKIHTELNLPYREFDEPPRIVRAAICRDSGKLPIPNVCALGPRAGRVRQNEVFAAGTQPLDYCDVHVSFDRVCVDSDRIATEHCPHVKRVIGIVKKNRYDGDAFIMDSYAEAPAVLLNGSPCRLHTAPRANNDNSFTIVPVPNPHNTPEPSDGNDDDIPGGVQIDEPNLDINANYDDDSIGDVYEPDETPEPDEADDIPFPTMEPTPTADPGRLTISTPNPLPEPSPTAEPANDGTRVIPVPEDTP